MIESILIDAATASVIVLPNIHGYFERKRELLKIHNEQGREKALRDISEYEKFYSGYLQLSKYVFELGRKLAERNYQAGKL